MNHKRRIVVDTNVLLSALLRYGSPPWKVVNSVLENDSILFSNETLFELTEVLFRSKFDRYLTDEIRAEFLEKILSYSVPVDINKSVCLCRDPKDDKFLEVALNGKADFIITGDEDLLVLHPFGEIDIVKPQEYCGQM